VSPVSEKLEYLDGLSIEWIDSRHVKWMMRRGEVFNFRSTRKNLTAHLAMIDIPQDFADALEDAKLADFFRACASSHQNEHLKWIAEAKRPETRKTRIAKAVRMLSEKHAEKQGRPKKAEASRKS